MRLAAVFLFVFFVSSCSNRTGIPKDILPLDSMQGIMKDIIMASQYSSQYISRDSLIRDKMKANQELLEDIFKIHHTTREDFKHSLDFYESRPDLNKKVFDSLSAFASIHQKDLYLPKALSKPHIPKIK